MSLSQRRAQAAAIVADQVSGTLAVHLSGHVPDLVTHREGRFRGLAEPGEFGLIDLEVNAFPALQGGQDAGF